MDIIIDTKDNADLRNQDQLLENSDDDADIGNIDARSRRVYHDCPENQKDPNAIVMASPQPQQQPAQQAGENPAPPQQQPPARRRRQKAIRKVPPTLNEPSSLQQNLWKPIIPQNDDPAKDAVFTEYMSLSEVEMNTFTPSTPAAIEISRLMYAEFSTDNFSIQQILLPEYLDYYTTSMIWFRMISLKRKLNHQITPIEYDLLLLLENSEFSIPEPLLIQLKVLGSIQTLTGEHLYPTFPSLPDKVIANHGGYYGPIAENTHNLYEEIPCLGVLSEAIRQAVSDAPPGPYNSSLAAENIVPNQNLLGFTSLEYRRLEAKNLAFYSGITAALFPETPINSGINIKLIFKISGYLAQTKTFKITDVNFRAMSKSGSIIQAMIQRSTVPPSIGAILEKNNELTVTCLFNKQMSVIGAAIMFSPQLWKTSDTQPLAQTWACINNPPLPFIANRNQRRNTLPLRYREEVFRSISENGERYRCVIIRKFAQMEH